LSSKFTIREATKKEVWQFFRHVIEHFMRGRHPELLDPQRLSQCDTAYVADHRGEIIGAITLDFDTEKGPELAQAYVAPLHRKRGVGTRLAEVAIERLCRERPGQKIYCKLVTQAMDSTLSKVRPELLPWLARDRTYEIFGDEALPDDDWTPVEP
jgi:GNAT superfamily N-acetyltransferase